MMTGHDAGVRRRALVAGAIGNTIEYYDYIIYGALATVLAHQFFPSQSAAAGLLSVFAVFAVAFLFRPLGGLLFGYIGDRWGRRSALSISVLLMSGATTLIGLLPTVATLGVWAAVLVTVARCLQGLASGGEWSGSAVYLVEFGPRRHRTLFASLTPTGAWVGGMLGVGVVTALNAWMGSDVVSDWAWRIPFLIAVPLGIVGFYLRLRLEDTPTFRALQETATIEPTPIRTAVRGHGGAIFVIFVGGSIAAGSGFLLLTYMVSYMTATLKVAPGVALLTNTLAIGLAAVCTVLAGVLADRRGPRPVYLVSLAAVIILAVPSFLLMSRADPASLLLGQCLFAVFVGAIQAPFAVFCVEFFPAGVRYSAAGMGHSLGTGILGGISPLIAAALVSATGWPAAPALYPIAIALVALVVFAVYFAGHPEAGAPRAGDPVAPDTVGRELRI